jgi:hypothetical protein
MDERRPDLNYPPFEHVHHIDPVGDDWRTERRRIRRLGFIGYAVTHLFIGALGYALGKVL